MRLVCDVEVLERTLATLNVKKSSKPIRGQLSVGRNSQSDPVYMMLCTSKDKSGTKYRIKDNIDKVFTRFLNEGKATIRLKNPEKDICISKADVIHLKSFLNVLRLVIQGKELDRSALSTLAPASNKNVERPKTHMIITTKKNYPLTTNFPMSLTNLEVHDCGMRRLDSRICKLRNLAHLDLSDNSLSDLPNDLGLLQNLVELKLRNNKFEVFPVNICNLSCLKNSLKVLDFSDNGIKVLPVQICELKELHTLKMDNNSLELIPPTIGRLQKLEILALSKNKLTVLPAGFMMLRLANVDLFGNCFMTAANEVNGENVGFPTLLECAARYVKKKRILYSEEDLHPHLCRYLDSARLCWCGNYCFQCSVRYTQVAELGRFAAAFVAVDEIGTTSVPVQGFLCSQQCLNKYRTNPNAYWK